MKTKSDVPFAKFLEEALKETANEEPFDPTNGNTHYKSPLFTLAKKVKGRKPRWTAEGTWQRVNSVVTSKLGGWHRWNIQGFVPGETNADGGLEITTVDDLQADFINSFEQCRVPGSNPLEAALGLGDQCPYQPSEDHDSKGYCRFLSLCEFMPHVVGQVNNNARFFLPCRCVGKVLSVNRPNTIATWIKWAQADGHLVLICKHNQQYRQASEFVAGKSLQDWAERHV